MCYIKLFYTYIIYLEHLQSQIQDVHKVDVNYLGPQAHILPTSFKNPMKLNFFFLKRVGTFLYRSASTLTNNLYWTKPFINSYRIVVDTRLQTQSLRFWFSVILPQTLIRFYGNVSFCCELITSFFWINCIFNGPNKHYDWKQNLLYFRKHHTSMHGISTLLRVHPESVSRFAMSLFGTSLIRKNYLKA